MSKLEEWFANAGQDLERLFQEGEINEREFRGTAYLMGMPPERIERAIEEGLRRHVLAVQEKRVPAYRAIEEMCDRVGQVPDSFVASTPLGFRTVKARRLLYNKRATSRGIIEAAAHLVVGLSTLNVEEPDE